MHSPSRAGLTLTVVFGQGQKVTQETAAVARFGLTRDAAGQRERRADGCA